MIAAFLAAFPVLAHTAETPSHRSSREVVRDRFGNKTGSIRIEQGKRVIRDRAGNKVGSIER